MVTPPLMAIYQLQELTQTHVSGKMRFLIRTNNNWDGFKMRKPPSQ